MTHQHLRRTSQPSPCETPSVNGIARGWLQRTAVETSSEELAHLTEEMKAGTFRESWFQPNLSQVPTHAAAMPVVQPKKMPSPSVIQRIEFERSWTGAVGGLIGRADVDADTWKAHFNEIKAYVSKPPKNLNNLASSHRLKVILKHLQDFVADYDTRTVTAGERTAVGRLIEDNYAQFTDLQATVDEFSNHNLLTYLGAITDPNVLASFRQLLSVKKIAAALRGTAYLRDLVKLPQSVLDQLTENLAANETRILKLFDSPRYFLDVLEFDQSIDRGVGAAPASGHTFKEHGAHLSDAHMQQLATQKGLDKGRWASFDVQYECIKAVLDAVRDPNPGPLSAINAAGWATINNNHTFNTVTKPGNPHLAAQPDRHPDSADEILNDKANHGQYLKAKVEAKNQPAGRVIGQSFPPGGGPAQDATRYDVILELDQASFEYKVLTAYPVV